MRRVTYRAPLAGRGRVLVPTGLSRVAGGVGMHGACSVPGLTAAWMLQMTTRWRVAPFSRRMEAPELPAIDWQRWRNEHAPWAAPPHGWVVGLPADRRRQRFHLLLLDASDRQVGFAKFSTNPLPELVIRVREQLDRSAPKTFWTPKLLTHGSVDGWHFTVDSAMPPGFHRPARLDPDRRREILEEIRTILRPATGETVVHGDFGPWNVRATRGHPVIVLDWEEVTLGPAGADELWHALNWELIRDPRSSGSRVLGRMDEVARKSIGEAAKFWLAQLGRSEAAEIDERIPLSGAGQELVAAQKRVLGELSSL